VTAVLEGADLFCGAGGFTTGTEDALAQLGLTARLRAVNHWPLAIETHRRNHPHVDHYVQDVTLVDPLARGLPS
jgi:DNA (cytosine-5)-methyltransferase 1